MIGQMFGRWTVISKAPGESKNAKWTCKCACGNEKDVLGFSLKKGESTSCGCYALELSRARVPNVTNRKTTEQFVRECISAHGDKYDYSGVVYANANTNIEITCNGCNGTWMCKPRNHLSSGKGCPICATSGFKPHLEGTLYVLQNGNMTKVGITNRKVSVRVQQISKTYGSPFKVVREFHFSNGQDCANAERTLLKSLRATYNNPDRKFDGYTECFVDVCEELLIKQIEELST